MCVHTNMFVKCSEVPRAGGELLAFWVPASGGSKDLGPGSSPCYWKDPLCTSAQHFPLTDPYPEPAEKGTSLGNCLCCVCMFLSEFFCVLCSMYCQWSCVCLCRMLSLATGWAWEQKAVAACPPSCYQSRQNFNRIVK